MQDLTTDYVVVKARPGRFVWGKIVQWHEVGRYQIVEYFPAFASSRPPEYEDQAKFHIYLDKKSTHTGASTLESALVIAIAMGNLEVNHARHMSTACLKILDLTP
jgi:hypothetical protein